MKKVYIIPPPEHIFLKHFIRKDMAFSSCGGYYIVKLEILSQVPFNAIFIFIKPLL